ncbi:MAG: ribonuclease III [Clostridia bacterium]|nr:ribonuclease III [Clostridia bacterium]
MENPQLLSPSTLAFVGDGVYGLLVRERLAEVNRPAGELHNLSVKMVNANAQAEAFGRIAPLLTEQELSIFKRGRNFHTTSIPKSSDCGRYHTATGLEALFGYLYLKGNKSRLETLFAAIWEGALTE